MSMSRDQQVWRNQAATV